MSGKLGAVVPAANTDTTVYTVPAGKVASINVTFVNRGAASAIVNLAIATSATPANADFIEFGVEIPLNGILERTGLVASAGELVVVRASTADCSVRVHGFEKDV
jgi:hypothetical protein